MTSVNISHWLHYCGWSLAFHVLECPFIAGRTVDFLDRFCATDGHVFNKLGFAGLILQVPFFKTGWTTLNFLLLSWSSFAFLILCFPFFSCGRCSFHFEEQYYKPLSQNFVDLPNPLPFLPLCFHIIGELENILFEWCLNFLALIYVQIEYIFFFQIICNRILFYM